MPLANKEVVHLKHGWEKIQVGTTRDDDDDDDDARFSFFRVLERATLRTHHHHLHFLNRISKKKALLRVLSARKLTRCILRSLSLSLSLSLSATTTTNQTGIQKLKNLLDNKNGANGEEPQGFDATEFMGHYT